MLRIVLALALLGGMACTPRTGGDKVPPGAGGTAGSSGAGGAGGSAGTPLSSFPLPTEIDLGGESSAASVADVDRDGYLDLAALVKHTGEDRATLVVVFGDAEGVLAARFEHDLAGAVSRSARGSSSNVVSIGDLDGDGQLDIATAAGVALGAGGRALTWQSFGSEAAHAFQPAVFVELDTTALVRGSVDGWVERCSASGACQPLPGQTPPCAPGEGCAIEDVVVGDFDGDTRSDVLAGGVAWLGAEERVWLWVSLDDWQLPLAIDQLSPVDLEAGDIDQDGVDDVVAQTRSVGGAPAFTELWLGAPGGTSPLFHVQTIQNQQGHNDAAALADASFDTCLDLAEVAADSQAIAVRLGSFLGEGCTEQIGPHDPSAAADTGWLGTPGAPGAIGVQLEDANGDGVPEWILRAAPSLRFVAVTPL
jgi:hypothetical protein